MVICERRSSSSAFRLDLVGLYAYAKYSGRLRGGQGTPGPPHVRAGNDHDGGTPGQSGAPFGGDHGSPGSEYRLGCGDGSSGASGFPECCSRVERTFRGQWLMSRQCHSYIWNALGICRCMVISVGRKCSNCCRSQSVIFVVEKSKIPHYLGYLRF
jgi:hypothetical protein